MLGSLFDAIGGWRTVRERSGFSYQESRGGKRRIVPVEGWSKPGLRDEGWVTTGQFADDAIVGRYGDFNIAQHNLRKRRDHAMA